MIRLIHIFDVGWMRIIGFGPHTRTTLEDVDKVIGSHRPAVDLPSRFGNHLVGICRDGIDHPGQPGVVPPDREVQVGAGICQNLIAAGDRVAPWDVLVHDHQRPPMPVDRHQLVAVADRDRAAVKDGDHPPRRALRGCPIRRA